MFDFLKKPQRNPFEVKTKFGTEQKQPTKSIFSDFILNTLNKLVDKVNNLINKRLDTPILYPDLTDLDVVDLLVNIRERFGDTNERPEITVRDFKNLMNIYINNMLPPQEVMECGFSTKPRQTFAGLLYPSIDGTAGFLKTDTLVLLVTGLNINQKNDQIQKKNKKQNANVNKGLLSKLIEKGMKFIKGITVSKEDEEEDPELEFENLRKTIQIKQYDGPSVSDIIEGFELYPGTLDEYRKELENILNPKILEQLCNAIKVKQKLCNNQAPASCGGKEIKIPEIDKCVVNLPWHKILFWKLMYNTSPNTLDIARCIIRPLVKPIEDFVNKYVIKALKCTGCYSGPRYVTWYEDIIYYFIYHQYEISCTYMYFREGFRASGWRYFLLKRLSGNLPKDTNLSPLQLIMLLFLTVGIGVPKPPENIDEQVVDYFKGGEFTQDDIKKLLGNVTTLKE